MFLFFDRIVCYKNFIVYLNRILFVNLEENKEYILSFGGKDGEFLF